jgi:LacI family transcriptional regulator
MTIYDIAKLANVSKTTVSRVINGSPNVSDKVKKRVLNILNEYNYVPSSSARNLAGRTTKSIAIMAVNILHTNYSTITYNIERKASLLGYNVYLCNTTENPQEQEHYLRMFTDKNLDCLIMIGEAYNNKNVAKLLPIFYSRVPIITFNCTFDGKNIYNVYGKMDVGIEKAMNYLYDLGHRKIVFIRNHITSLTELKVNMYLKKMQEFGLAVTDYMIYSTSYGYDSGIDAVNYFNENNTEYTAVIGCDDLTAIGIIKGLKAIGKSVPRDVSVVGYLNSIHARTSDPELTTIDNNINEIANSICKMFTGALAKQSVPSKIHITPSLVIRESTASPVAFSSPSNLTQ